MQPLTCCGDLYLSFSKRSDILSTFSKISMNVGQFGNLATEKVTDKENVKWKIHICIISRENGKCKN